jgi:hypothetical protein
MLSHAVKVADLYGRYNPDKFRGVLVLRSQALLRRVEWEKLVLRSSSTTENGLAG